MAVFISSTLSASIATSISNVFRSEALKGRDLDVKTMSLLLAKVWNENLNELQVSDLHHAFDRLLDRLHDKTNRLRKRKKDESDKYDIPSRYQFGLPPPVPQESTWKRSSMFRLWITDLNTASAVGLRQTFPMDPEDTDTSLLIDKLTKANKQNTRHRH